MCEYIPIHFHINAHVTQTSLLNLLTGVGAVHLLLGLHPSLWRSEIEKYPGMEFVIFQAESLDSYAEIATCGFHLGSPN